METKRNMYLQKENDVSGKRKKTPKPEWPGMYDNNNAGYNSKMVKIVKELVPAAPKARSANY